MRTKRIDQSLVGKTLVQFSHDGEEPWERPALDDRYVMARVTAVRKEKGATVVVVGGQDAEVQVLTGEKLKEGEIPEGRRAAPRDGLKRAKEIQHIHGTEYGIGSKGWVEVTDG